MGADRTGGARPAGQRSGVLQAISDPIVDFGQKVIDRLTGTSYLVNMIDWSVEELTALSLRYAVPAAQLTDKKERKQRAILAAATARFAAQGYRKTSVDEVARDAGVGKGTVFLYFGSKAELLVHCILLEKAAPGIALMRELAASTSAVDALRGIVFAHIDMLYDLPLTARLAGGDHELRVVLADLGPQVQALLQTNRVERIQALLAPLNNTDAATFDAVSRAFTAMLQAAPDIIEQARSLGLDRKTHAEATTDLYVAGVLSALKTDVEALPPVDLSWLMGASRGEGR